MLALQELTFYYKLTHNELPAYFQNWQIVTNSELHRHNTRRKHDIHIVGFRHAFAKRCIRINLPRTLNATPQPVKDKLFTHSFRGFVNYAKLIFIQKYTIECTITNCYTVYVPGYRTKGNTLGLIHLRKYAQPRTL